jgi:chromate reductase
MTASPAYTGGARHHSQMRETLSAMLARVITRPQVVVASAHEKIRDGRLVDEVALRFAFAAVDDLLKEIRLLRLAQST